MRERAAQHVLRWSLVGILVAGGLASAAQQHPQLERLNQQLFDLYRSGRYAEGVPVAQEALRIAEQVYGAEHPTVAESLNNLAEMQRMLGRFDDARPLYDRALRMNEKSSGPENILSRCSRRRRTSRRKPNRFTSARWPSTAKPSVKKTCWWGPR
ncbi:MAG: Tetratricopeptide 1 repeat-containing protein [Acidobacteria bacterium]|nr:Tetratricopeptide 1 repeat-containing protein [Acidobacteriota bacterium]